MIFENMKSLPAILVALAICAFVGCKDTDTNNSKVGSSKRESGHADITSFSIDRFQIGDTLSSVQVERAFRLELANSGIEINHDDSELTSIHIDLGKFDGKFFHSGEPMAISTDSSPTDIRRTLQEPYWQHNLDGDTLLFYESQAGSREVTFTFNVLNQLRFIDISDSPIFADEKQRERYGVNKPWPPGN